MGLPLFWIDAFARSPFAGNPAAVVPLPAFPDDARMQRVAFEHGLAETAFLVKKAEGHYDLRWFTPRAEVDLCGHATLASAHAVFHELGFAGEVITFESKSGPLRVRRRDGGLLELDFPVRELRAGEAPVELSAALGVAPLAFASSEANLVVLGSEADVRAVTPDFPRLAKLEPHGTIVTAPGTDCDFVSRFFAPSVGIDEDHVTGSAHCVLMPYWSGRLGKTKLHARQISERGGELWCELAGDRVKIAGHAVLYMRGEILV